MTPALTQATLRGGALEQYVTGPTHGRLMMGSSRLVGSQSQLAAAFVVNVLKLGTGTAPTGTLTSFGGLSLRGEQAWLPDMVAESDLSQAVGLSLTPACEPLYRFEACATSGCFGLSRPRPPYDPIVVARWPLRTTDPLAQVISVSIQPDAFNRSEAIAAFGAVLTEELGVQAP